MTQGSPEKRRRLSMIRDFRLADLITLANGFAGMGSILFVLRYVSTGERSALWAAFCLLPLALILDVADGWVARRQRLSSAMGQELDSLADLVSFGVAPAALAFALGMNGGWDALVLIYFVGCGISRLARFNATASSLADEVSGKVKYFEGTPIPTSLLLVAILSVLTAAGMVGDELLFGELRLGPWRFHPLVLIFAASGSAMISKTLRIPKP